ncbi:E3 ubiquitin/ISG15 ligase TRIM25 [Xenopus laevis]|uniref:Uncharacterized protein n=2 Tax=Xenopus laevis TaxID=8355 RepID=A0A974D8L5_XENLA|nr:E3 ubiquitin/ISG15 ligase TRIM25 [Xenopus laevis]OCT86127.1 hypothetical protein XELAEV_18019821mg [Xenopus laevis]
MASADLREDLLCSVCLHIYTDPVTLRCGHNFCQGCIQSVLATQEASGVFSCPECRAEFRDHSELQRNTTLCSIVEHFLSTQPSLEDTRIFCTYCLFLPVPAFKTCLLCEASLCDNHVKVHNKSAEHVLTEPTTSFGSRKCSMHNKLLELYCSEDCLPICSLCCLVGEHKGHQVESLNTAVEKTKGHLRLILDNVNVLRDSMNKRAQNLQVHKKKVGKKASGIRERVIALFQDLQEQLKGLEKRVLGEISRQEEQVSKKVSDSIYKLEGSRDKLFKKISRIEEICNQTDPLMVLQEWESCSGALESTEEEDDAEDEVDEEDEDDESYEEESEEEVNKEELYDENEVFGPDEICVGGNKGNHGAKPDEVDLYDAKEKEVEEKEIEDNDNEELEDDDDEALKDDDEELEEDDEEERNEGKKGNNEDENDELVSDVGDLDEVLISMMLHKSLNAIMTEAKAKSGFYIREASDLVLDVDTVANDVILSSDLKAASWSFDAPVRPESPKRFESCQVLSSIGFTCGRHCWEVDTSQSEAWHVGVAYTSIEREDEKSSLGSNNKSWCLRRYPLWHKEYSMRHNSKVIRLPPDTVCQRLGIFLDYEVGRLSFYELGNPIRLLYTFSANFTEPLHAAFSLDDKGVVRIKS